MLGAGKGGRGGRGAKRTLEEGEGSKEEVSKKRAVTARWHQRRRVRAATRKKPLFILIKRSHAGEAIEYSRVVADPESYGTLTRPRTRTRATLNRCALWSRRNRRYALIEFSQLNPAMGRIGRKRAWCQSLRVGLLTS
ncbi:hypothetical protein Trydic_g19603 [Trypoxylus dichotomus]